MQRKSFAKKSRQMKNGISYFNIKKTIQCLKQTKQDKNHRKNKRKTHFYDDKSESFNSLSAPRQSPVFTIPVSLVLNDPFSLQR